MTVRAKFRCNSEIVRKYGPEDIHVSRSYEFTAMYDPTVPEDQRYAKATPTGQLTIAVDNPAVTFVPGKFYYLDFTPTED